MYKLLHFASSERLMQRQFMLILHKINILTSHVWLLHLQKFYL